MEKVFKEFEELIAQSEVVNPEVSAASVGWHLSHSLKAVVGVCKALQSSDPATYRWKFNLARTYVFTFNNIPRGKGKVPEAAAPAETATRESLTMHLEKARNYYADNASLKARHNFDHPYFGVLNLKQSLKFMRLHSTHHLKIIRDILAK